MTRRSRRALLVVVLGLVAVGGAAGAVGLTTRASDAGHGGRAAARAGRRVRQLGAGPSAPSSAPTPGSTAPAVPAGPPFAVDASTLVLTDPSRPTPARGDVPGYAGRTLRTLIRSPQGAAGPLPLVVFAHGFDVEPETYETLLDSWAAAGYLVAAPAFPGSAADLPGAPTENDIPEQALDITFVLDQLLTGIAGRVDPARIAVVGHSDGGSAVAMLALDPADTDPRIRAYVVLAGQIPDGVPGPWEDGPTAGALLAIVGDADEYGNLPLTTTVYQDARMVRALVVAAGGDHVDTFLGTSSQAQAVRSTISRFLALVLGSPTSDATQLAAALGPEAGAGTGLTLQTAGPG